MRFERPKTGAVSTDFARPYVRFKPDDQRRHPRLDCKGIAEIRFLDLGERAIGTLMDLSVTGCCIECGNTLPEARLQVVEVHLRVNSARLRVAGVVRNIRRQRRVGIEFTGVSSRKAEQIRLLVRELAGRRLGVG
jgi:hypothetical protein